MAPFCRTLDNRDGSTGHIDKKYVECSGHGDGILQCKLSLH